jgi:hypothetical protein
MLQHPVRATIYGLLIWLIAFAIAIPVYSPTDQTLMHGVENLAFPILLMVFFFDYMRRVALASYTRESVTLGVLWMVIQIVIDVAILLILFKSDARDWFFQVALSYLSMPPTFWLVGLLIDKIRKQ